MRRLSLAIFLLLFLFACQTTQPQTEMIMPAEKIAQIRYSPADVQKMRWLAGIWKGEEAGRVVRQSFQFHTGNALEVIRMEGNGDMASLVFSWHDGRYYYGQNRQWVVTWIGDKDVRFDPLVPGTDPMTWTRLNDNQWHVVRHVAGGDETTLMERAEEMQP